MVKPLSLRGTRFLRRLQQRSHNDAVDITYLVFGDAAAGASRCIIGKGSDGTVFLPAVMHSAGEEGALLKAGLAKVAVGKHKGHYYMPADWLRHEFGADPQGPQKTIVLERMVAAAKSYQAS